MVDAEGRESVSQGLVEFEEEFAVSVRAKINSDLFSER
jgi:hypothetical protein